VIVGSLVLILAAAGLLIGGLSLGSDVLLGGSIVASLMSAVMLYIGARQSASVRAEKRSAAQEWNEDTAEYDGDAYPDAGHDRDAGYDGDGRYATDQDRRGYGAQDFATEPVYDRDDEFGGQDRRDDSRTFDDGRFDDLKRLHEENARTWEETEQLPLRHESDPTPGRTGVTDPDTTPSRGEPPLDQTAYVPPVPPTAEPAAGGVPPADAASPADSFPSADAVPPADATAAFPPVGRGAPAEPGAETEVGPEAGAAAATAGPAVPPLAGPLGGEPAHSAGLVADETDDTGPEGWVGGGLDDEDPKDEPPIQRRATRVAAHVARMVDDVLVIDGRPRYHVAGCVHLLGRESEPLPVDEAVDLGFTPCSLCEPDTVLTSGAAEKARR